MDVRDREMQNHHQLLALTQKKVQSNGDSLLPLAKVLIPGLSFHQLTEDVCPPHPALLRLYTDGQSPLSLYAMVLGFLATYFTLILY